MMTVVRHRRHRGQLAVDADMPFFYPLLQAAARILRQMGRQHLVEAHATAFGFKLQSNRRKFGRNQTAGPRLVGPRLTRAGKVSKAKGRRWNGRTAPHNTASETTADIEQTAPRLVERAVGRAVRRYWD